MKPALLALLLAAAALLDTDSRAQGSLEPLSAFPQKLLAIKTHAGSVHHFNVWIADRTARQEQGLMFVERLEDHRGMLFVYPNERELSMWMKNTLIPLDMLFIRADGKIAYIADHTKPQSLDIISAPTPARAVLELGAGTAEKLAIRAGDAIYCDALAPAGKDRAR